jgi:two-component system sensor histidine kinase ArlS
MLRILLALNIVLCLLFVAGLIIRAEQTAAETAEMLNQKVLFTPAGEKLLMLSGYSLSPQTGDEKGFLIPKNFKPYLSKQTAYGIRSITFPSPESTTLWERLHKPVYNITVTGGDSSYRISYQPQKPLQAFIWGFAVILLLELLILLRSIFSGAKMIRKTLQPIEELAQTTQSLSNEGIFEPGQLKDLAIKLEKINSARLDTKISVGETQNELKSLASAINGMLDRINESYRSQVQFVSDASHELRTPISVIQGYVNLLDRWGKKDERTLQESIDAIKDETENMKNLVEQLLFLARGDSNARTLMLEHLELSAIADEVLRETKMIDNKHEYQSDFISVYIKADKSLIKQAIRILVDNAIKYTPSGKQIIIIVKFAEGYARLTVQDEGIGIAPEAVPKVFNRFFRDDESRAKITGGSGLGLSIAKWIVERHGGHMEVISRLEIGTRITILLPIAQDNTCRNR